MSSAALRERLQKYEYTVPELAKLPVNLVMEGLWNVSERVNVKVIGHENLLIVQNHFKQGGSALFEGNHTSHFDHVIIRKNILGSFENDIDRMIWLIGTKSLPFFYDKVLTPEEQLKYAENISKFKKKTNAVQGFILQTMADVRDMEIIPTVQSEIIDTVTSDNGFEALNRKLAYAAMDTITDDLKQERVAGVPFYQGGRKEKLTKGEQGSEIIIKMIKKKGIHDHVLHVPLGIHGSEDVLPHAVWHLNLNAQVTIYVGKPYYGDDAEKDASDFRLDLKHIPLLRIGALMDPLDRGFYNSEEYIPYLKYLEAVSGVIFDAKETSDRT